MQEKVENEVQLKGEIDSLKKMNETLVKDKEYHERKLKEEIIILKRNAEKNERQSTSRIMDLESRLKFEKAKYDKANY